MLSFSPAGSAGEPSFFYQFHENADQLYRSGVKIHLPDKKVDSSCSGVDCCGFFLYPQETVNRI
jgi:hypothetical protein